MRLIVALFLVVLSANIFAQNSNYQYADMTHWENYNPPDDPGMNTGWLESEHMKTMEALWYIPCAKEIMLDIPLTICMYYRIDIFHLIMRNVK